MEKKKLNRNYNRKQEKKRRGGTKENHYKNQRHGITEKYTKTKDKKQTTKAATNY